MSATPGCKAAHLGRAVPGAVVVTIAWLAAPAAAAASDAMIAILDGSSATALLQQCSRSAPALGEATWMPTRADVARLEALLPQALSLANKGGVPNGADVLARRARQYVGLVRGGRRFLYANFIPVDAARHAPDWRRSPVIICDGGPSVFGMEINAEDGSVSHLDFNGR